MTRNAILAVAGVAAALLLAGGAVDAKNFRCDGGTCVGTERADEIVGTNGADEILGRRGDDRIVGEPQFAGPAANDTLRGGAGDDLIDDRDLGNEGSDADQIFGGKGDDRIVVDEGDGTDDVVDCGPGTDTVFFDPTDTVINCEIQNPA